MKIIKILMLFCLGAFFIASNAIGQANPSVGILPLNPGGIVAVGAVQDIQVQITNTLSGNIVASKLRPNITVPSIATILPDAQQTGIPAGWVIVSNIGDGTIRVCNGSDVIGGGQTRNIIIKVRGTTIGVDPNLQAQINFGGATCAVSGPQPSGNVGADDFASATLTVVAPAACSIAVSASAGTIACNGGTTTLTATATGTSNTVEYSLNGGAFQASNIFTVNAAGSPYTVTAREVATPTCTANSAAVTVAEPTSVVATGSVTSPIATIGGTGAITVSATGGTAGTTTYVINSGTTINTTGTSTGVFTGLLAGSYTFIATKNGCPSVASASVVLNNPTACIITSVSASAGTIACNGGTTTLTATALPVGTTYEYSVNGGAFQAANTFTLAGGTYTVTARETANTACTATAASVTISNPTVVVANASVTTPIAVPGGTGSITVTTTGGTAGTTSYVITSGTTINTTGATTGIFTGLLAGAYTFTVTKNGCSAISTPTTLANPGVAKADPAVGQMYFTTTGGAVQDANALLLAPGTSLYDINVPFYNLNQLNVVPNGTINFTVNLGSKLILAPGFNLATAPLSTYFTWAQSTVGGNVILTGTQIAAIPADFDAVATFRVKGDSACKSNVVSNIVITNQLQTLSDDDLNNNSARLQYTLPITLSNAQVNVTCNGAANGIINVTVSSGTTVVTTGPAGYTNTQSIGSGVNNFTLSNLAPGTYTITATATSDASLSSCSAVNTVIILQPTVLTIANNTANNVNNTCFGASAGSITVTAAGGTSPYTFTIVRTVPGALSAPNTTGASSGVFTGLPAGTYTVTVTDNNGCAIATTTSIVITQPVGGTPDITLGSDITGSLFATPGVTQTIVYNIAEINGTSAVGDTIRITKVAGFTINFNPTIFSTTVGSTTYALDNPRWKIDNSNPAFVSIILTDPGNPSGSGILFCNQLVRVAVTLTRNTSNISTFPLSARLRQANGEVILGNNLNSIVFTAD